MTITSGRAIDVKPLSADDDLSEFLRLSWKVQEEDPFWVPPILSEQKRFLDPRKGPFFEIGEAQYFMGYDRRQVVGRISAHVNRIYEAHHDRETGFFGFFECIPDWAVSSALLDAACQWLRAKGKSRIVGPLSFSIYDNVGVLVEGFDSLPAILQGHNPPYYEDLIVGAGFRKAVD